MIPITAVNKEVLVQGLEYSVGTNDGMVFNNVVYTGTRNHGGKPMMCFQTREGGQLTINPSYNSFALEEVDIEPKEKELN